MSLTADIEIYKNGQKEKGDKMKTRRRNSRRRKPKNGPNMQENECDEKIREIMNFLTTGMTSTSPGKMYENKPSVETKVKTIHFDPPKPYCEMERKFADAIEKNRSTSEEFSVPVIQRKKEKEMKKHGKEKCGSPLANLETVSNTEAKLQIFLEKMKTPKSPHSKSMTSFVLTGCCPETSQVVKKFILNEDLSRSNLSTSEINKTLLISKKTDNFGRDKSHCKKSKANKEKKLKENRKGETMEKSAKSSNKLDLKPEEFNGQSMVIINSRFKHENVKLGKGKNGENSKKDQPGTSNSPKSKRKWFTDTKFPKYLTEEEMSCVSKFGILLSGVIRINQKNFKEAYITAPDKGMDILIDGLIDRNRALDGDEVYYILKGKEHFRTNGDNTEIQRTAAVVAIKNEQHCRRAVGTVKLKEDNSGAVFFYPRDCRMPKILIKRSNWSSWIPEGPTSFGKRLFYAEISKWSDVRFAEGKLTKEIGNVGDIESETSAILLTLELDRTPYPDHLKAYLPKLPYAISSEDLTKRQDFRNECIFTIDPASAKDLDDAVSCKLLPNGNYQIGVHISDVTYFLHKGSPLDAAVAQKATSIYLVQEVHHMLPRELCELCSLTPGENKLAFSVVWEMTPNFEVVMYNFMRSVINSCGKFSYDQIQEILDGSEKPSLPEIHGEHTFQEIIDSVKLLNHIAINLRKKRFENGALRIDQIKINFTLDEFGFPLEYEVYVNKEAHRLIEEFMLLANITVAQWISLYFPKVAMLRSHSPPQIYPMKRLQKNLKKYGIDLDISSSKSLHESLVKYSGSDLKSTARMMVLNSLLAKPMNRANYYCTGCLSKDEDQRHYALNIPLYTHFTSPIRRYADVMVHRLLAASLGYGKVSDWTPELVSKIADNCNKKKYAAKLAGEKSTELFLNIFTLRKGCLICQGAVYNIKQKFFECILLENGSHQRVYMENLESSCSVENENGISKMTITWPSKKNEEKTVQIIELFSIVKIELRKCDEENKCALEQ